jgi:hypothetical protein
MTVELELDSKHSQSSLSSLKPPGRQAYRLLLHSIHLFQVYLIQTALFATVQALFVLGEVATECFDNIGLTPIDNLARSLAICYTRICTIKLPRICFQWGVLWNGTSRQKTNAISNKQKHK